MSNVTSCITSFCLLKKTQTHLPPSSPSPRHPALSFPPLAIIPRTLSNGSTTISSRNCTTTPLRPRFYITATTTRRRYHRRRPIIALPTPHDIIIHRLRLRRHSIADSLHHTCPIVIIIPFRTHIPAIPTTSNRSGSSSSEHIPLRHCHHHTIRHRLQRGQPQ
jgi:hypothetical protein